MASPTRRSRSRFVVLLLLVTALSIVTLDFRGFGPLETVHDAARSLLDPVVGVARSATTPLSNVWHGVRRYDDLERENTELRQMLTDLRAEPLREQSAQQQLDELKAQLDILTASNAEGAVARVIGGPVSNFENNVRIDKGRGSGIERGMVVVTDAGLVGRVVEVTADEAVVELADSRDFGVTVHVPSSAGAAATFVLRGQGPGRRLTAQGSIPAASVRVGDAVLTTGSDTSVFPPDILVGRVSRVPEPAASGGASPQVSGVEVELSVDPSVLAYVTVLLWKASS